MKSVIKDIKIKYGEELKGRVLKIHSKKGSFETPTKAPTSTELNGKGNIGFDGPFLNSVFEITQRYDKNKISNLHMKNGVHSRRILDINAHADTLINRYLVKFFPQYSKDVVLTDEDMLSFIELQCESNINVITLPEIKNNTSVLDFKNNLKKYWEFVEETKPEAVLMPYLNLSQDAELFREKLKILSEYEGSLLAIGIKFASVREFRPNLRSLASFSDKEFWVHCSAIKRANWNSSIPSNQLHILQRYGIDTVSIEIPMAMGRPKKEKPIFQTKYFNRSKVTIPNISDSISDGELTCDCPICRQQNFEELSEDLRKYAVGKSINAVLNDFSKVHEVYASTEEFKVSRQMIKDDSLKDYFSEKEGLKDDLKNDESKQTLLI